MEGDEDAATVWRRKLLSGIERQVVGRPVRRERGEGVELACADADLPAVAAVFRCEHELAVNAIVVAKRPTVIAAPNDVHHLLRGQIRTLLRSEELRPVLSELIAALLGRVDIVTGGIHGDAVRVADASGIAGGRRE